MALLAIAKQIRTNLFLDPKWIRTQFPLDQNPKTDLSETIVENSPVIGGLIRSMYKFAKSVTETNSKVPEPRIYNKAINDLIYENG